MPKWKLYHNPQCSKSRDALNLLVSKGMDFQTVEYLKTPLSREELTELIPQLDTPIASLVRQNEAEFQEAPFDVNSIETVASMLAERPRLMERPILQGNGKAIIARPVDKLKDLI